MVLKTLHQHGPIHTKLAMEVAVVTIVQHMHELTITPLDYKKKKIIIVNI